MTDNLKFIVEAIREDTRALILQSEQRVDMNQLQRLRDALKTKRKELNGIPVLFMPSDMQITQVDSKHLDELIAVLIEERARRKL